MTIIPGDLPGLAEAWAQFYGITQMYAPKPPHEYDLRIPADRCLVAFWMARVLGVPVGATVPEWEQYIAGYHAWSLGRGSHQVVFGSAASYGAGAVPSLSTIPLDSPDRDALALACCARWLADEIRAGRITPKETA